MPIQFKMFPILAGLSKSKTAEYEVAWVEGMTAQDLIDAEGFPERDQEAIAVVVNAEQAGKDTVLKDGDRVELLVNIAGGAYRRGALTLDSARSYDAE